MAEKMITATGRRKTSVARVFLRHGKGAMSINDRSLEEYFGRETDRMIVLQPFGVTQAGGSFDIEVNVKGGGVQVKRERSVTGLHARSCRSIQNFAPHSKRPVLLLVTPALWNVKNMGAIRHESDRNTPSDKSLCLSCQPILDHFLPAQVEHVLSSLIRLHLFS